MTRAFLEGDRKRRIGAGDPRALVSAICTIIHDPVARTRMAEAGRRVLQERFDVQCIASRLLRSLPAPPGEAVGDGPAA